VSKLRSIEELFAGRHFDREVIILCVRWYLRYKLSFRDLVEMMSGRGLHVAHTTIMRWVRQFAPEFIKRWNRFGKQPEGRGESMKPISRFGASGLISIEPWTRLDGLWTSVSAPDGMWKRQRRSFGKQSGMDVVHRRLLTWTAMPPPIARSAK